MDRIDVNAADATGIPGEVRITVAPFKDEDESDARWAAIAVEDDGIGLQPPKTNAAPEIDKGIGLKNIQARVRSLGGTFLIDANGILRQEWRKVRVKGHADEVLEAAQAL